MANRAFLTVGEVAELIGVNPRTISQAFYDRKLDVERCEIAGGRRLVPQTYVAEIAAILGHQSDDSAAGPAGMAEPASMAG
jgi:hypothetical protein